MWVCVFRFQFANELNGFQLRKMSIDLQQQQQQKTEKKIGEGEGRAC